MVEDSNHAPLRSDSPSTPAGSNSGTAHNTPAMGDAPQPARPIGPVRTGPAADADVVARVAEYLDTHGRANLDDMRAALGMRPYPILLAANELVGDGRATKLDASTWGAPM